MSGPYAADMDLAYRLTRGNAAAVDEFCANYTARVHLYVTARLADASSAEHDDLTQVIIIAALKSIKHYRARSSLMTWVLSIAHNKVADALKVHIRRRAHEVSLSEMSDTEDGDWDIPDLVPENEPETAAALNDLKGQIRKALHMLKPEHQEVLILRYIQDLQVAEVAQILGLNKRKAEYRLTEARTAFRRVLAQLGMNKSDT
jgi:RNA polymerase sigma-70 factor (ECF subfamily)